MSVTFSYPTTSPTHTVTLPNPQLGDSVTYDIKTLFKRAMDGTMHSFIKTPVGKILNLNFIGLNYGQYTDLVNLLLASAGAEVKYVDHDSNNWNGHIINDPASLSAVGPLTCEDSNGTESYSISLTYEGDIV